MISFRNRFCVVAGVAGVLFSSFFTVEDACAGRIVLNIKAGNPVSAQQKVPIRSNLPRGIKTNDVINTAGLELGYDVRNDVYYVHKEVELGPKEIREFNVEINDIWTIAKEETDSLRKRTETLTAKLAEKPAELVLAKGLKDEIGRTLDTIDASQVANAMKGSVKAVQHIRAYETDMAALRRAKRDIGKLENLVLGAGFDPGGLVGEMVRPPNMTRGATELPPEKYKLAVWRVSVSNSSPSEIRKINAKWLVPAEVRTYDIVDAAGLEIGSDPKIGACYVFKNDVEVGPNKVVTFDLKIRDKWNINGPRFEQLTGTASNLMVRLKSTKKYDSIAATVQGIQGEIAALTKEQGPVALNEKYVDFHRRQAEQLDAIEQKLYRIDQILKPLDKNPRYGVLQTKPPSPKTTWIIIFSIVGFLFIMSLLFFLRWYGRGPAENMDKK